MLTIKTHNHTEFIDITDHVQKAVSASGVSRGLCMVYVPHTTAAVTINENADPNVPLDLVTILEKTIPWKNGYRHMEGNSAAHMKTSLVGASEMVAIENGRLVLGTWQSLFFCEFDGPRNRNIYLQIIRNPEVA